MNTNICFHSHSDHGKWDTRVMEHHNEILQNSFVSMKISLIATKACACTSLKKPYFKHFFIFHMNLQCVIIKSVAKFV